MKKLSICICLFVCALFMTQPAFAAENGKLTLVPPAGYTDAVIYIDGRAYNATTDGNGSYTISIENTTAKTAIMYQYNSSSIPVGMYVWKLDYTDGAYTAEAMPGLQDLISYHGFSIRITGKSGIRFKSGIDVDTREKLINSGVDGYTLVEYGTLVMNQSNVGAYPFIKDGEKVNSGRSYWTENGKVYDNIVETVNNRYRFASVLIGIPASQYKTELAFRGYMVLTNGAENITLYGPIVGKSIYNLAEQLNSMKQYKAGSNADLFIKKIMADATTDAVSKKGIQGLEYLYGEAARAGTAYDWNALGVKHVLLNLDIAQCVGTESSHYGSFTYKGKTYYYNQYLEYQKEWVNNLKDNGVEVTMVLLMSWKDSLKEMTYAKSRGPCLYQAWDVSDERWEAFLYYIFTEAYPTVDRWIVGNEANMPNDYNHTGTLDLNTNANVYADEFLLVYNMLGICGSDAGTYISIDRCWAEKAEGIAGNKFLPAVINAIESKQNGVVWNVAQHAYAPDMFSCNIWNNGQVTHSWDTRYLCATNIDVLTDYIRDNYGEEHRVILSEQGFHAGAGEDAQAAGIAFTYYVAQFNDMIDAVMFRSYSDDSNDGDFRFGLINWMNRGNNGEQLLTAPARKAYYVFKYMDTAQSEEYTNPYVKKTGAGSWIEVVPDYNPYMLGVLH